MPKKKRSLYTFYKDIEISSDESDKEDSGEENSDKENSDEEIYNE